MIITPDTKLEALKILMPLQGENLQRLRGDVRIRIDEIKKVLAEWEDIDRKLQLLAEIEGEAKP